MSDNPTRDGTSTLNLFRRFVGYTLRIRNQAAITAVLVVVAPITSAALLWSFKLIVDDVFTGKRIELLPTLAALYLAIALTKTSVDYFTQRTEAAVLEQVVKSLRVDVYAHVLSRSPGSLKDHATADILTRLSGDTDRTEYLIYTGPLALLADGAAAVFFTAFLFYLSWQLSLATMLVLPAFVWASYGLATPIRRSARLSRTAQSQWMSLAEERLGSTSMIHAFGQIRREVRAFDLRADRARRAELKMRVLQALQAALIEIIGIVGGLIVIAVGTHQIASGSLTVGTLLAFVGTVGSLFGPLRSLAKASGRFQHAAAGADRVAQLLDVPSLVTEKTTARRLTAAKGQITFQNVGFAYPNGQRILQDISFSIEPGETVALVGPSGAGKSTLARLALRLQDPTEGSVLIDGVDLRDITLASLRDVIVPVLQDAFILTGTIAGNIAYGAEHASPQDIRDAAEAAYVDQFARPSDGGLDAPVGRHGGSLSGGQRQRIALARALVTRAPILLLDEAIAAVDSETEELIQAALDKLVGRHTILTVAHRLSSIKRADRVVVIEHGRIVEIGTPAQLLGRTSRCRDLFAPQLVVAEAAE